jgi:protein CpxP
MGTWFLVQRVEGRAGSRPINVRLAASGPGEIMKTRDITMLCVAMVVGSAPTTAPATVAAATLRAPVILAQAAPAPAAPAAAAPAPAVKPRMKAAASKAPTVDNVEARIKDLHARLKITPAQEDLWNKAAQVMRENATAMDAIRKARSEKAQTMTAVEDFKSYAEMTEAHADGIKRFIPVFSALYDSMSDAQKENTDTIFRRGPAQKASR